MRAISALFSEQAIIKCILQNEAQRKALYLSGLNKRSDKGNADWIQNAQTKQLPSHVV